MARKQWTVLVWMAGDNDLDASGVSDLDELKRVGSTDDVDVVVQFDRRRDPVAGADPATRRYHVQRRTSVEEDVVAELGETNGGDPTVATDFFCWGIERYPSEHVLVVLWNHGSGIDETDIYRLASDRIAPVRRRGAVGAKRVPLERARQVASSGYRRALFATTVEAALKHRGILYDDSARDFLDNQELRKALEDVRSRTGRTIDVLGFDACLMNMIEVAYELRGVASYMVGSEEVEPGEGWPYDAVLEALTRAPDMAPADLAGTIVSKYVDSYGDDRDVTQSALDLARAGEAAAAIDTLAEALRGALATTEGFVAFTKAAKNVQRFGKRDFADLGDFCDLVGGDEALAAHEALAELVIAEGHRGAGVERATGAAIYLPTIGDTTVVYDGLEFARATRWDELLDTYRHA